ncbi:hypothetical protein PVT68_10495 [Microbulbifer bruguierae]|uniref:DUF6933 domain-containing protein n=1 Tax=Microbulbifer bruguierae TaxID=3029061 RepID=A0ABY8N8I1_9GAMM|nr:hypothetical protein [Microbulbifer bruguierae]WGL15203.1 hypothetical protein PVT68_10495 [Microbulbifer bruguierae]
MIIVHGTKKLLAKLIIDDDGHLPLLPRSQHLAESAGADVSPLSGWHANFLTIQRRNCVLLVHDETRFPLFIPALTKPDLAELDWWFGDALMNTLLKCNASQVQLDTVAAHLSRLSFDSDCDRSVQGTMNQMAQDAEYSLYHHGVHVAEITGHRLAAWLADRPCTVKGRKNAVWPVKAFLQLLDGLPRAIQSPVPVLQRETVLPGNIVNLLEFRKKNK